MITSDVVQVNIFYSTFAGFCWGRGQLVHSGFLALCFEVVSSFAVGTNTTLSWAECFASLVVFTTELTFLLGSRRGILSMLSCLVREGTWCCFEACCSSNAFLPEISYIRLMSIVFARVRFGSRNKTCCKCCSTLITILSRIMRSFCNPNSHAAAWLVSSLRNASKGLHSLCSRSEKLRRPGSGFYFNIPQVSRGVSRGFSCHHNLHTETVLLSE